MVPNVGGGNHVQQPPTIHGNFHTPNAAANIWNDPLGTLPSYTMDLNGNAAPNPSIYYPITPCPADITTPMGYPFNHISRNHPPFHPNQHKDFY